MSSAISTISSSFDSPNDPQLQEAIEASLRTYRLEEQRRRSASPPPSPIRARSIAAASYGAFAMPIKRVNNLVNQAISLYNEKRNPFFDPELKPFSFIEKSVFLIDEIYFQMYSTSVLKQGGKTEEGLKKLQLTKTYWKVFWIIYELSIFVIKISSLCLSFVIVTLLGSSTSDLSKGYLLVLVYCIGLWGIIRLSHSISDYRSSIQQIRSNMAIATLRQLHLQPGILDKLENLEDEISKICEVNHGYKAIEEMTKELPKRLVTKSGTAIVVDEWLKNALHEGCPISGDPILFPFFSTSCETKHYYGPDFLKVMLTKPACPTCRSRCTEEEHLQFDIELFRRILTTIKVLHGYYRLGSPFIIGDIKSEKAYPPIIKILIADNVSDATIKVTGEYSVYYGSHKNRKFSSSFSKPSYLMQPMGDGLKWGEEFLEASQIYILPDEPSAEILVNCTSYKGALYVYNIGTSISIVNAVDVEDYLISIINPSWLLDISSEALDALTIAMRTEAYYRAWTPSNQYWHVDAKQVDYPQPPLNSCSAKEAAQRTRFKVLSRVSSTYDCHSVRPFSIKIPPENNSLQKKNTFSLEQVRAFTKEGSSVDEILRNIFSKAVVKKVS